MTPGCGAAGHARLLACSRSGLSGWVGFGGRGGRVTGPRPLGAGAPQEGKRDATSATASHGIVWPRSCRREKRQRGLVIKLARATIASPHTHEEPSSCWLRGSQEYTAHATVARNATAPPKAAWYVSLSGLITAAFRGLKLTHHGAHVRDKAPDTRKLHCEVFSHGPWPWQSAMTHAH
jgi:hypothetical protein